MDKKVILLEYFPQNCFLVLCLKFPDSSHNFEGKEEQTKAEPFKAKQLLPF